MPVPLQSNGSSAVVISGICIVPLYHHIANVVSNDVVKVMCIAISK